MFTHKLLSRENISCGQCKMQKNVIQMAILEHQKMAFSHIQQKILFLEKLCE
jgi:hypothetical protein